MFKRNSSRLALFVLFIGIIIGALGGIFEDEWSDFVVGFCHGSSFVLILISMIYFIWWKVKR